MAMLATPPVAPLTSTLPFAGREAVQFHQVHRERGGVAGDAERARLEQRQAPGQGNDPVGGKAPVFGVAAVVVGAQAEAVHDDLVAPLEARIRRLLDHARQVDAGDERKLQRDLRLAARGERVLVVDARVGDADDDVAQRPARRATWCRSGRRRTSRPFLRGRDMPSQLRGLQAVTPPSATMTWPVMNAAASEARNTAMPPMSRGSPRRRSGVCGFALRAALVVFPQRLGEVGLDQARARWRSRARSSAPTRRRGCAPGGGRPPWTCRRRRSRCWRGCRRSSPR